MIKKDGRMILTVHDWNTICKYFLINPKTVCYKEYLLLTTSSCAVVDIYTGNPLVYFYDHDGMIRVFGEVGEIAHTVPATDILKRNPDPPSVKCLATIRKKMHKSPGQAAKDSVSLRKPNTQKTDKK